MIIKILLATLIVLYAPIPLVSIIAHKMTLRGEKVSLQRLFFIILPLIIVIGYLVYNFFSVLFVQSFSSIIAIMLGVLLLILSLSIEIFSRKELGSARILGSSQLQKKDDGLIMTGIYAFSRHPRYVEHPLVFLGTGLLTGYTILLLFSAYLIIAFVLVARYEEKELIQRYGKDYLAYKKKTPAFFIPLIQQKNQEEQYNDV